MSWISSVGGPDKGLAANAYFFWARLVVTQSSRSLHLLCSKPQKGKKTGALWLLASSDCHLPKAGHLVPALPNSYMVLEKHLLHLRCPHCLSCSSTCSHQKVGNRSPCSWAILWGTGFWMWAVKIPTEHPNPVILPFPVEATGRCLKTQTCSAA